VTDGKWEHKESYSDTQPAAPEATMEEINAAIDLLKHGVTPSDIDVRVLKYCVQKMNANRKTAVSKKKYLEAEEWARLIELASKATEINDYTEHCVTALSDLITKRNLAGETLEELTQKWKVQFEEFEEMVEQRKKDLYAEHEREISEFDATIPDELPPRSANIPRNT
jgi:hypothetical protein